jgi:hypothetical protein
MRQYTEQQTGFELKIKFAGKKVFALYPEGNLIIGPDAKTLQGCQEILERALMHIKKNLTPL